MPLFNYYFLFIYRKETWIAIKCPRTIELLSLDASASYGNEGSPICFVHRLSIQFSQKDVSLFWLCDGPSFVVVEKDPQVINQKDSQWMRVSCKCWIKKEFDESETAWSYHESQLRFTTAFSASIANIRLLNFLNPIFVKSGSSQHGIAILGPLKTDSDSFVFGKLISFGLDVVDNNDDVTKIFWGIPSELVGKVTSVTYCWSSTQEAVDVNKSGSVSLSSPLRMLFGLSDGHIKMYSGGIPLLSEKLTFAPNTVRFAGPATDCDATILAESYRKGCLLRWETMLLSSKQFIADPVCTQINEFDQSQPGKACVAALPWQNPGDPDSNWKLYDILSYGTQDIPTTGVDRLCDIVKESVNSADVVLESKRAELESIQASIDSSLRIIEKISKELPSPLADERGNTQDDSMKLEFLIENVSMSRDIIGASFPIALTDGSRCRVTIAEMNETGEMAVVRAEGKKEGEQPLLIEPLQKLANQLCEGKCAAKVRKSPFSCERKRLLWSALRKLEKIATALESVATADESSMIGHIKEVISITAQLDLDLHEICSDGF